MALQMSSSLFTSTKQVEKFRSNHWWHAPGNQDSRSPGEPVIRALRSRVLPNWVCMVDRLELDERETSLNSTMFSKTVGSTSTRKWSFL